MMTWIRTNTYTDTANYINNNSNSDNYFFFTTAEVIEVTIAMWIVMTMVITVVLS